MAVMATEQPPSLLADQKAANTMPEEDKMIVDEPVAQAVNGHEKTDETQPESEKTPVVNGKTEPTETNKQAFAVNGSLPEQTPSKANADEPATGDSEMTDVNGGTGEAQPEKDVKIMKDDASAPSPQATAEKEAVKDGEKATEDEGAPVGDTMDVDVESEVPDVLSSAEHGENTQETSATAITDSAMVSSPQEPKQPTDSPKPATNAAEGTDGDVTMGEAELSTSSRTRREREDEDTGDQPAAKRAKTEETAEDSIGVATGPSPSSGGVTEENADSIPDDQVIALHHSKEIRRLLGNIKKKKSGGNFRASVEKLWPQVWDSYKTMITTPVDITLFEQKLREEKYATFGEFKADVRLLYENALTFNGPGNMVTQAAAEVKAEIFRRLAELASLKEPAKAEKGKSQPTRHAEPRAVTQPRRPSHSQPRPASASSPKPKAEIAAASTTVAPASSAAPPTPSSTTSASAPVFALPPNGVPQIRRDSTRDDGDRPKRPIVPPKNRDPDYSQKGSRKKKLEPEMRFYLEVITELLKPKYQRENFYFKEPVDPVAQQIPTYFSIVKKPMDLRTIHEKLENGEYRSGKDVEKDMKQIVTNSETFNGPHHEVTKVAQDLEGLFKGKVAGKESWMARQYPASSAPTAAASPDPSDHESEEDSGPEPEEHDNEAIRNLQTRIAEEQEKLATLINARKPDITMVEVQQSVVAMLQKKLVEEKVKLANEPKKSKSKKKSTKKSKPSANNGAVGSNKKAMTGSGHHRKPSTATKKSAPKKRVMGGLEKAVIAEGINELDGALLTKAVEIIKRDTRQKEDDDGQLELDIESLSVDAMAKLYDMIMHAFPHIYAQVAARPEYSKEAAELQQQQQLAKAKTNALPKPKKNKPMNKEEQERRIEQLRDLRAQLNRGGSGSQEPVAGEEEQRMGDTSGDEEESDSEEE